MAAAVPFWVFAVAGVGLSIIDVRRRRLPHVLTGGLWVACVVCFGLAAAVEGDAGPLWRAIIAGVAASAALLVIAFTLPGQLGLGDVVLGGVITLSLGWLSWQAAALGILVAFVLQGVVGLAAKMRAWGDHAVPMGPALWAGWLLAALAT
ncbi:prepilin peptidase [Krasilnikovia sp. MM14-A1259]|uniref:prepilin peptidase n=1 Tax=Krasilnikovia sp. MM14-A1259 TaxID=3373539 RepID=UPI00399D3BE6